MSRGFIMTGKARVLLHEIHERIKMFVLVKNKH